MPTDPTISAFIFDMDGTMIDSMPYHARSWEVFARRHGLAIELDDLMARTTGRTGAECMRELFQRDMPETEAWALIADKEAIYRELFAPVFAEVPGFAAFHQRVHERGYRVGVGTAGDRHNIAFAMGHLSLNPQPHSIVGGDEGLRGKPEPDIFLEAARRLGVEPARCVVFEDAPFGIEAARRAGMKAVAVCSTHSPAELTGPHVLTHIRHYGDLADFDFLEPSHVSA